MSYSSDDVFKSVRSQLLFNKECREKRGLPQDRDGVEGEVFLGNYKKADFDALPLRTKRKGGPARLMRLVIDKVGGFPRVHHPTYAELYKDHESFAVFVHSFELDVFGIEY
jgi:hypothetical protein